MAKTDWTDIDRQGRKMSKMVKFCEAFVDKESRKPEAERNHDLILAYMDRLIKCSTQQSNLTTINMKLNILFKLAEKEYGKEIAEDGLRSLGQTS